MANPQKENGYVGIANEIVEKFYTYRLSGREWQVLWVVIRKVWGWGNKADKISYSQFSKATGIEQRHIVNLLTTMVNKKLLIKYDTRPVTYSFNKDYDTWGDTENGVGGTPKKGTPKKVTKGTPKTVQLGDTENGVHNKQYKTNKKIAVNYNIREELQKLKKIYPLKSDLPTVKSVLKHQGFSELVIDEALGRRF